jgi:hypothetical protein
MSLPEEHSTLEEASPPIARKNSGLAVSSVTPSLIKGNGGGDQFLDENLFVDERTPSSMTVPKMHLNNGEHMLIPVTVKMIHSAVYTCKRFMLRDGRPLHLVKLVGAVWNYHNNMKNIIIDVEDGMGFVRVIVWRKQNECKAVHAMICKC